MAAERRSVTLFRLIQMFVGFYFAIISSGWVLIEYHEEHDHPTSISRETFKAERVYRTDRERHWIQRDREYVSEVKNIRDMLAELRLSQRELSFHISQLEKYRSHVEP